MNSLQNQILTIANKSNPDVPEYIQPRISYLNDIEM